MAIESWLFNCQTENTGRTGRSDLSDTTSGVNGQLFTGDEGSEMQQEPITCDESVIHKVIVMKQGLFYVGLDSVVCVNAKQLLSLWGSISSIGREFQGEVE